MEGGKRGEAPEWYTLLKAAQFLSCAPWELLDQPAAWSQWAIIALNAEAIAQAGPKRTEHASMGDALAAAQAAKQH